MNAPGLGALLRVLCAWLAFAAGARLHAQAPANLAGFEGKLLRLTSAEDKPYRLWLYRCFGEGYADQSVNADWLRSPRVAVSYARKEANRGVFSVNTSGSYRSLHLEFVAADRGTFSEAINQWSTNTGTFQLVAGTNEPPLMFSTEAQSRIMAENAPLWLSVEVTGFDLTYQWQHAGTNLTGPTAKSPFFSDITAYTEEHRGDYRCLVRNELGEVISAPIHVRQEVLAQVVRSPQSVETVEGGVFSLDFEATGDVDSLAWQQRLPGTSTGEWQPPAFHSGSQLTRVFWLPSELNFTSARLADAGDYRAVLIGSPSMIRHEAISEVARVTVHPARPELTWLGRPFVKVAEFGKPLPGQPETEAHIFTGGSQPRMHLRDGVLHFVANTSLPGGPALFRWHKGELKMLGQFGNAFDTTTWSLAERDIRAGFVGLTVSDPTALFEVIAQDRWVPFAAQAEVPGWPGLKFTGIHALARCEGRMAAVLTTWDSTRNEENQGVWFHDGTNFTRIADRFTPLPGVTNGFGSPGSENFIGYDGQTVVFSTRNHDFTQGGSYRWQPGGPVEKLRDHTDIVYRNNHQGIVYAAFADVDVAGGTVFGVSHSAWAFTPDGTGSRIGLGSFVSAAGPNEAYLGTEGRVARWKGGAAERVITLDANGLEPEENFLFSGSTPVLDGRLPLKILGVEGQGDDLAMLVVFTEDLFTHRQEAAWFVAAGPAPTQPVITDGPHDFRTYRGERARFVVNAAGEPPLSHQWWRNDSPIAGETNALLVVTNVNDATVGRYRAVVRNRHGEVISREAALTIVAPRAPVFLQEATRFHPYWLTHEVGVGDDVALTLPVAGAEPMTFRWFENYPTRHLPTLTGPTLLLKDVTKADARAYDLIVSNAYGQNRLQVYLNVTNPPPFRILDPLTQVVAQTGDTVRLDVSIEGGQPPWIRWTQWAVRSELYSDVRLFNSSTAIPLTLTNVTTQDSGTYEIHAADWAANAHAYKEVFELTVLPPPPQLSWLAEPDGRLSLQLPTSKGWQHVVEANADLAEAGWTIQAVFLGDGSLKTLPMPLAGHSGYFRVRLQQPTGEDGQGGE